MNGENWQMQDVHFIREVCKIFNFNHTQLLFPRHSDKIAIDDQVWFYIFIDL